MKPLQNEKIHPRASQIKEVPEEAIWKDLSQYNFLKGYGPDEPEYSDADIKEFNPEYKA